MDFASKFVLNNVEEEYECISDDEFHGGMELSGSSDNDIDSEDECEALPRNRAVRKHKSHLGHHWRQQNQQLPLKKTDDVNSKRWFRRADTNVVSVSFDTLMSPGNMHAGDPVICSTCQAILSNISKPSAVDNDNMVWKCEFCGNSMTVDIVPDEIPNAEEVTFLMEPGKATASASISGRDESLVVFCVDTSGSMCVTSEVDGKVNLRGTKHLHRLDSFNTEGESQYLPSQRNHNVTYVSRLQAMQAAVDHQLGEMAKDFPHRRVALVAFSNDVTIIGDGYQEEVTVAGDKLLSNEQLSQIGSSFPAPQAIQKSCKKLADKVYKLEEGGATALGPALVVAINMASSHPGSKVIVCTDGKANIGLGNLDTEDNVNNEDGTEFYTTIGQAAVAKGVSVSVTTIQGTDCKLVHLGKLADNTGGQVNIVDPLNLTKEFGNILADQIIATNVKSKFLVHKALYIVDESNQDSRQCLAEFSPGNVQTTTTITFEFARRHTKSKEDKKKQEKTSDHKKQKTDTTYDNSKSDDNKKEESEAIYDNSKESPAQKEGGACAMVVVHPPEEEKGKKEEKVSEYPFQLQIEYTDTEGTKALRVITRSLPATDDRKVAESAANLQVLGSHAAKTSADLALQGEYSKSRGKALMNQRLAWRSSHTNDDDSSEKKSIYRNIYSRIKTMENKLQRKQTAEIMSRGRTYSDDEDEESYDTTDACVVQQMSMPNAKKKKTKKFTERSVDMDDSLANLAYNFRRASQRNVSIVQVAELPPPPLPRRRYMEDDEEEGGNK